MKRPRFVLNARRPVDGQEPSGLADPRQPAGDQSQRRVQGVLCRARVMDEGESLVADVNERHELTTTRTALAEIFLDGGRRLGGASRGDRNTGEH